MKHDRAHFKSYDPPKHDRVIRENTHETVWEQEISDPVNLFEATCRGCGTTFTVSPANGLIDCKCGTDLGWTPMTPKELP